MKSVAVLFAISLHQTNSKCPMEVTRLYVFSQCFNQCCLCDRQLDCIVCDQRFLSIFHFLNVCPESESRWKNVEVNGKPPGPRTYHTNSACLGDRLYVCSGGEAGAAPVSDPKLHVFAAGICSTMSNISDTDYILFWHFLYNHPHKVMLLQPLMLHWFFSEWSWA